MHGSASGLDLLPKPFSSLVSRLPRGSHIAEAGTSATHVGSYSKIPSGTPQMHGSYQEHVSAQLPSVEQVTQMKVPRVGQRHGTV